MKKNKINKKKQKILHKPNITAQELFLLFLIIALIIVTYYYGKLSGRI